LFASEKKCVRIVLRLHDPEFADQMMKMRSDDEKSNYVGEFLNGFFHRDSGLELLQGWSCFRAGAASAKPCSFQTIFDSVKSFLPIHFLPLFIARLKTSEPNTKY
jgi:hypothetical protein